MKNGNRHKAGSRFVSCYQRFYYYKLPKRIVMAAYMTIAGRYTTGLLDISAPVCYNADNIRHEQPETGCCAEILFERSCRE